MSTDIAALMREAETYVRPCGDSELADSLIAAAASLESAEPVAQEPYMWEATVNGAHTVHFDQEPPEDAYDEGTLKALYLGPTIVHQCAGRNCGPYDIRHSAACFEDFEKSAGLAPKPAVPVAWYSSLTYQVVTAMQYENMRDHGGLPGKRTAESFDVPLYRHPPAAVPEGWKLVPVEPTEAMGKAAREWQSAEYECDPLGDKYSFYDGIYRAMLAASPEVRDE